ncbi:MULTISPECIES: methyltransferase domain-containing protein [Actinomadura]|uniref:Methyltransferase domain-containing protein n=1 Tax=Actinomadura yumaensis TaxID=111807 RepID=A0ABW2CUR6_9ACTN|nr:methyltransferase domain-containing protein [Actinomadura sp. J1-007]MWK36330.1 methyltransferase domain-containing protein [Actinomadura sp. J1-007]
MTTRTRAVPAAIALGFVADGLWRRSRAARLPVLNRAARTAGGEDGVDVAAYHFVTTEGVRLDGATRQAACAYAADNGLDVVELVPAGLDTARALEFVRRLDPASFREARLARGEGAGHAVLVSDDVLRRAGLERMEGLSADEMDALSVRLKQYAPTGADVAVVPGLRALPASALTPGDRRAILRRRWQLDLPTQLTGVLGAFGLMAAVSARRPLWASALLAAVCANPVLATFGTPLRPNDLRRFSLLRPVAAPLRWWRVARAAEAPDPALPGLRAHYRAELAQGVARFLEAPRDTCPWCGGTDLRKHLVSGDHQQRKPGTFRLDRCASCGHVFQNPRLSGAGLAFYYRDYYDGVGEAEVERGFRLGAPHYRARARMLRGRAVPATWLDVGGGHGHFCNAARDIWPDARFDALDFGSSVIEAERRGWVDLAHRGQFRELADKLTGTYDVVSMHHYLEHTLDPLAELDAAAEVLPPGGHLLIEVPDPQSPVARLAGRWWHNWFQPQHLHLMPIGNLTEALAARGLRTVAVDRGAAHQELDLLMVVTLLLNRLTPRHPDRPWNDPGHRRARIAARVAITAAGMPFAIAAAAADQLAYPFIRRFGGANTYRVLARKTSTSTPTSASAPTSAQDPAQDPAPTSDPAAD